MVRFEAYLHFKNVEYRRQSGRNIRLDKVLFAKGVQGDGGLKSCHAPFGRLESV